MRQIRAAKDRHSPENEGEGEGGVGGVVKFGRKTRNFCENKKFFLEYVLE